MTYECTEDTFLKDVANHQMTVIRDDGVHRHIRFKRKNEGDYWFDLITWPGTLCIDGDCGTYVFRRLEDMFEFFRVDREQGSKDGRTLFINPGYWGEKLQAVARHGGYKEFSEDRFIENIKRYFEMWVESNCPDDDAEQFEKDSFEKTKEELWDEIDSQVIFYSDGEVHALEAAQDFGSEVDEDFNFSDFYEYDCTDYTFHFIWCCYAIAWSVQRYDSEKAGAKDVE